MNPRFGLDAQGGSPPDAPLGGQMYAPGQPYIPHHGMGSYGLGHTATRPPTHTPQRRQQHLRPRRNRPPDPRALDASRQPGQHVRRRRLRAGLQLLLQRSAPQDPRLQDADAAVAAAAEHGHRVPREPRARDDDARRDPQGLRRLRADAQEEPLLRDCPGRQRSLVQGAQLWRRREGHDEEVDQGDWLGRDEEWAARGEAGCLSLADEGWLGVC
ncbi:hypothetical protein BN1708_011889 [Verticillium longisporum]|uniref:Uncharacterized protein n=1 Tax=Verticillium longisporum TaxID=100787 RepID=A0A0G4L5F0_VERLO|nr:hypothetical protein BN1708_011889 [Verticillium longisporum]